MLVIMSDLLLCSIEIIMPNGWWYMPPEPVPADPGWDEDLAWLDRDPEREMLAGPGPRARRAARLEEEYEDYAPLTAEELAEIREAAADELLAVGAATTGRRGPGSPARRVFPGQSSSPVAAFGPGMVFDVLPGGAQLAVAADAAGGRPVRRRARGRTGRPAVRLGPGGSPRAARKLAVVAELDRRNPGPGGRGVHRGSGRERAGGVPVPRPMS